MTEPNGMYYMRARYYDPQTGRFISEDPMGFDGGDVNLYIYAQNNPIVFIDPNGEIIGAVIGGAVGAVVGGLAGAVTGGIASNFLGTTARAIVGNIVGGGG